MTPPLPNLLLIACSQRKLAGRRRGRAWDIYDGRLFQVLKKLFRANPVRERHFTILIVSAKYGVIDAERVIQPYEISLSPALAQRGGSFWAKSLESAVAGIAFDSVHVNLGRDYLRVLPDLAALFAPASLSWATGGIGKRNAQTRSWVLERIEAVSARLANVH